MNKKKIFIAIPNLGTVNTRLSLSWLHWISNPKYQVKIFPPEHLVPLDHARNVIRREFLKSGYDFLLTIDADIVPPVNILELADLDLDVVGPVVYIQKEEGIIPMAFDRVENGWQVKGDLKPNQLVACDSVAIGVVMIARRVLEKVPLFRFHYDKDGITTADEGFDWFDKVRREEFLVFLHTNYVCDHYKTVNLRQLVQVQNAARINLQNKKIEEEQTELLEIDKQHYLSKLDKNKRIALFEVPAACNLECPYCYVKDHRKFRQDYTEQDFLKWFKGFGNKIEWITWICSEGEPALYPRYKQIMGSLLAEGYAVATTTNLTQNALTELPDSLCDNLGILWSVHFEELKRKKLLKETFERAGLLAEKGATIAPLVIDAKSHLKHFEEINERFEEIGLRPSLRHERIFPQGKPWYHRELTGLWELQAIQKARNWGWSLVNYDYEHLRFRVKGGRCSAGIQFLATLVDWQTVSCGGCGRALGTFPEKPEEFMQGLCNADVCPCPFPHEAGMNSQILTSTLAESYGFNNRNSGFSKAVDCYLPNGEMNASD